MFYINRTDIVNVGSFKTKKNTLKHKKTRKSLGAYTWMVMFSPSTPKNSERYVLDNVAHHDTCMDGRRHKSD